MVPREPISPLGPFPGCIRTGSRNSEAADSDIFICGIYKHQQPMEDAVFGVVFVVCHGFREGA